MGEEKLKRTPKKRKSNNSNKKPKVNCVGGVDAFLQLYIAKHARANFDFILEFISELEESTNITVYIMSVCV